MRQDGWPARLVAAIEAARSKPFQWGEHDCATFFISCERAMCGESRFADLEGGYKTQRGAAGRLRRAGFHSLDEALASQLDEIQKMFAQRGDAVIIETDMGPAIGVVTGTYAYAPGISGLVQYPVRSALKAYRVT